MDLTPWFQDHGLGGLAFLSTLWLLWLMVRHDRSCAQKEEARKHDRQDTIDRLEAGDQRFDQVDQRLDRIERSLPRRWTRRRG